MRLLKSVLLIAFICSLFCCSQGPNAIYHSYHHVVMPWVRNDTLSFQVSVPDSLEKYQAFVLIRTMDIYPYKNLAIRVEHDLKDSLLVEIDTLFCDLTLKKDKSWDISEWGGLRQSKILLKDSVLSSFRTLHFKVNHLMENDSISGINDVGIIIER